MTRSTHVNQILTKNLMSSIFAAVRLCCKCKTIHCKGNRQSVT